MADWSNTPCMLVTVRQLATSHKSIRVSFLNSKVIVALWLELNIRRQSGVKDVSNVFRNMLWFPLNYVDHLAGFHISLVPFFRSFPQL